jgi:hypothetical protein
MNPYDPKNDPVGYKEYELGKKRAELLAELDRARAEESWQTVSAVAVDLVNIDSQIELIAELWDDA